MLYFIRLCKKPRNYFWKQDSLNTSPENVDNIPSACYYEGLWDDPQYRANAEKEKTILLKWAAEARGNRDNLPLSVPTPRKGNELVYAEKHFEAVDRLLELCRDRKIFVVVCVLPQWYGMFNFTQKDLENPAEEPYLLLLQNLNERPDCSVIICRDFEEITNERTDKDYLIDYGHMTRKGAILYTNWLVDRLLEIPKAAEAIRQRQE